MKPTSLPRESTETQLLRQVSLPAQWQAAWRIQHISAGVFPSFCQYRPGKIRLSIFSSLLVALSLCGQLSPAFAAVTQFWPLSDNAASTTIVATTGTNATLAGGDNTNTLHTTGPGGTITYALDLDGSADYIDISASSVNFNDGEAFSLSLWVNLDSLTNANLWGRAGSPFRFIKIVNSTTIRVQTTFDDFDFTVPAMSTGNWYHILITRTTGNSLRCFLNGVESSTGPITAAGQYSADAVCAINAVPMNGRASQARVYNSAEPDLADDLYAEGVDAASVARRPNLSGNLQTLNGNMQ